MKKGSKRGDEATAGWGLEGKGKEHRRRYSFVFGWGGTYFARWLSISPLLAELFFVGGTEPPKPLIRAAYNGREVNEGLR